MAAILAPLHCHAIEFGYLSDPASGQLLRGYGRHVVRSTRDYPQGCLPVATPRRVATHVGALPYAIDPDHEDPGALLISPSYQRTAQGALDGAWVTVQRIRLSPRQDDEDMQGDAVRSSALIFAWRDFARHAPRLGGAITGLRADPVSLREPREARLNRPRQPVRIGEVALTPQPQREPAANAILGAVIHGARLRIDQRWCASEGDFVAAYLSALGRLPAGLRGHVSAATGVCAADRGFQIAWCGDLAGLDPDTEIGSEMIRVGAQAGAVEADGAATGIADDPAFADEDGLVSPTFDAPEMHAHVRREVRKTCADIGLGAAGERCAEAWDPAAAAGALSDHAMTRPRASGGAARRGVQALLGGLALTTCSLDDIASAVELCEVADEPSEGNHVRRIRKLAGDLVAAQLSTSICPSPDLLNLVATRRGLARAVADQIAAGDERTVAPIRRALATMARREGTESPALRRIAGALLPRDHRIVTHWRGYRQDDNCLAQTLIDAALSPQGLEETSAHALADALIEGGKWNLVRDALAKSVSLLGRTDQGVLADPGAQIRRLRFIAALGRAMEGTCEPAESAPVRLSG